MAVPVLPQMIDFDIITGKSLPSLASGKSVTPIQVATLKATYGEPYGYSEPFDYNKRKLNMITEFFDSTKKRLNENSKVTVCRHGTPACNSCISYKMTIFACILRAVKISLYCDENLL